MILVHSRFSTNTFLSWERAQPLRVMAHNGEINTLKGNHNRMLSRATTLESACIGDDLKYAHPVIETDTSDSGVFDNVLELLSHSGRSIEESVTLMVPEPWQKHKGMDQEKKDYYEYNSCLMPG